MNTGTIIRTICLALALINQILTATGHSIIPIDDETIQALVSTIVTIVTALVAWWKNNDFTEEAAIGTGLTRHLKAQGMDGYIGISNILYPFQYLRPLRNETSLFEKFRVCYRWCHCQIF